MSGKINLVLMGSFTYPAGMAGTRRIQNVINGLKQCQDVSIRVLLQRQSSEHNALSGIHEGTPYETVMGDLFRARMVMALPLLIFRTQAALKRAFRSGQKNVIYFYGPLFLESIRPLRYAQKLGYRIVIDVIEDFGLAREVSPSPYLRARSSLVNLFSSRIKDLAAGLIVISTHLEEQCRAQTLGKIPLHYLPVSVDMTCFPGKAHKTKSGVTLCYAGSFSKKDGLSVLLDAFDSLAERHGALHLILTGRGDREVMNEFLARKDASPHKNRIDFKGYLAEKEYYSLLNEIDIPCMTRVDLAFAHAGFPFKLGEFLATGKPVIASRVSDVDRFLVHGHNALLVEAGSSAELCEAVEFLITHPEDAAVIGARGRDVAETYFDYRQQGKSLLTFLGNV